MKINKIIILLIFTSLVTVSCEIEDGRNLNGPSLDSVSEDLSRSELQEVSAGILSDMRIQQGTQVDGQSVAGREYWRVQSSDPRWTGDLLTGTLDNNTFYTTSPYAARYATIKGINLLLEGLTNTTDIFTDEEVSSIKGFSNTIKAHEFLMVLNQQYENGIRMDVEDPDNLGDFIGYDEALTRIASLLSIADADLANGGSEFPFKIPSGFAIASTPPSFLKFNKALAARVEVYRGNYATASTLLQNSFMDTTGNLDEGVYFTFSLNGADFANPLFFALNSSFANARLAHPSFITDARPNDARVNKAVLRDSPITVAGPDGIENSEDDLIGNHDVFIYDNNVKSVAIIRNEELLLLYAEANHISNPLTAVSAINTIRNAAGLGNYTGGNTPPELVEEILYNRRYSLFAEGGHRWIDLRRFNRLTDLPIDRPGDGTFEQFPTPLTENR